MSARRELVVLHVLEALEGGTARHVVDIVRHVRHVAHHVVVPDRRVGGVTDVLAVPAMEAAGAVVHRIPMRRNPFHPRNVQAVGRVRHLIRSLGPDVVHGHSAVGGAVARAAAVGEPVRRVYTPNGAHPAPLARAAELALRPLTDRVVAVSESEARLLAARGITDPGHVTVIPNGIDVADDSGDGGDGGDRPTAPSGPELRHLLGLRDGTPLVGFVGRLVPQKAPEVVVAAAALVRARLPDARVVMIGSGRQEDALRSLVSRQGLDGVVHLVPHVPRAATVMDQLDVLLLPSLYEGCPYVVLEAMYAGTPVVVSDAVGNRDLVVDGVTGRVTRQGDESAAAEAVLDVLTDRVAAAGMADAARRYVVEHHDVRDSAAALSALYRDSDRA